MLRIGVGLPLLFVTACGGLMDSMSGSTGLPDKLLPPPPWYTAWALEQAKLHPDRNQMAVARAAKLIWEARCGRTLDELMADYGEATFAQAGQMTIDAIGYEEIMRSAEAAGWVERVRVEQSQSAAAKRFIGDVPPSTKAIVEEAFRLVMTKTAPVALVASQVDTPAPGPGDLVAVGIFAVSLVAVGGISIYIYVTHEDSPVPTPQPQPAPRRYPNQTCDDKELDRLEDEMHKLCDSGFAATCGGKKIKKEKLPKIPCSAIKLSLLQRRACMAARWLVQNKCFGGKPDAPHKDKIDQTQNGIDHCEALEPINCAKDHPMAGK